MRQLVKKGVLLNEILEIVLAGVGMFLLILLLILLLFKLISPKFDPDAEAAKSYLKSLKTAVAEADKSGLGNFLLWQNENIFLVYFGNQKMFAVPELKILFVNSARGENNICMCIKKSQTQKWGNEDYTKATCTNCISLSGTASYLAWIRGKATGWGNDKEENIYFDSEKKMFAFTKIKSVDITKKQGSYLFRESTGEYCIKEGEVIIGDGRCVCDIKRFYTSKGNFFSYIPPCEKAKKEDIYYLDSSLEGDIDEKGLCVGYYRVPFCFSSYILGTEAAIQLCHELEARYDSLGDYYEKATLVFDGTDYLITREDCYNKAKSDLMIYYFKFYTDWEDNRKGNLDDEGYCAYKLSNGNIILKSGTRQFCIENPGKLLFLLVNKGTRKPEAKISTHYTINAASGIFGKDFSEEEIKQKCPKWESFDLTFIKGKEKDRISSCQDEIKLLASDNIIENVKYYISGIPPLIDDSNFCCYAFKIK
ncbi:hypothetical protein FJZ19_05730 [Candidatus Pacearchaeota archaeon]|nr:hypothetical protein [Candidatus Pacearchaeota archaeon]